jgi:mono/diheme cytochrome c family protein
MLPIAALLASSLFAPQATAPAAAPAPTFHETIEPLLQRHCQECHRAGGSAPFSLESFDDARGSAPQIEEMVQSRRMPPWSADPAFGKFANDRSLPAATIESIVRWVEGGAPEGDPKRAPAPRAWPKEWSLPEAPDLVLTTPAVNVPAEGTLPYEYVRVPTNLAQDRWVRAAEVRSTNPQVVHHVLVFLDEPRRSRASKAAPDAAPPAPSLVRPWRPAFDQLELLQGAKPGEAPIWLARFRKLIAHDLRYGEAGGLNGYFVAGVAGGGAARFAPDEGKFLPAGSELVFQVHHQPNGKTAESTTSIGLWFAKEPCTKALDTRGVSTVVFEIPPNAPDHEVRASWRLPAAATLRSLQPHMHRRGKDFLYTLKLPASDASPLADRGEEILLRVPKYDFDWQHEYVLAEPRRLPAGSVLSVVAHFDNSAANPRNPDPAQTVWFGLQTNEEMMIGYFEVVWDPSELDEGD